MGGVEKWSSRRAHNSKVVGSSPTPTISIVYVNRFFF